MIDSGNAHKKGRKKPLLDVRSISKDFGGIKALNDVSLHVVPGEILAIIGPNGAGKTTLLNCISRLYPPSKGEILFENTNLLSFPPHKIPSLGIARMFQNIELFKGMTVIDNVLTGRLHLIEYGILGSFIFFGKAAREEVKNHRQVEKVIDFLEIQHIRRQVVGSIPYGLQKRVELARALAMEPKILLLDEPVAGMNMEETEDMARFILDINEELGITIILIDHDMGVVMDISDRIIVLNFGQKLAEGDPKEIYNNPEVIKAYLGKTGPN
ncbi:MAG: ABC transporter ATP-binding protein [Thermodesulfobacteriota bacterium]|nr:ABC transporter ATP-binding protein [Thermodesulfobacteriota bacterium]